MGFSRREYLSTVAAISSAPVAGCLNSEHGLLDSLKISITDDNRMIGESLPQFDGGIRIQTPDHSYYLTAPNYSIITDPLETNDLVRIFKREGGVYGDFYEVARYTHPDPNKKNGPIPRAQVVFDRSSNTSMKTTLVRRPNADYVRLEYPGDRPDQLLFWTGTETVQSGLPRDGEISVYCGLKNRERKKRTYTY